MKTKLMMFMAFSVIVIASCSHSPQKKVTYQITHDTLSDVPFFITFGIFEDNTGIYHYGKKQGCDSLYLYKLSDNDKFEFYSFLTLPDSFVDNFSTDMVSQWVFINLDTVIAYQQTDYLAVLDIKNNAIVAKESLETELSSWDNMGIHRLQWNKDRRTLLLINYSFGGEERKYNGDDEFMVEYSFEKAAKILPVKYPYEIFDTYLKEYAFYSKPLCLSHGDTFVTAFNVSPIILRYDAKNNKTDSLYVKNHHYKKLPVLDTSRIKEISYPNFIKEVYLTHSFYETLLYNPHKDIYYRFFGMEVPLKDKDGLYNTLENKQYGVTLLDKNLAIIGDVCFKPQEYYYQYYVTSKGLFSINTFSNKNWELIFKTVFDYE